MKKFGTNVSSMCKKNEALMRQPQSLINTDKKKAHYSGYKDTLIS